MAAGANDTKSVIANSAALAKNTAERVKNAVAGSELAKGLGILKDGLAGFLEGIAPMAGMAVVFAEAAAAIKLVANEWKNYDLAADGVELNPMKGLPEHINEVKNEYEALLGKQYEFERAVKKASEGSKNPLVWAKVFLGDVHGNQRKAVETVGEQLKSLEKEQEALGKIGKAKDLDALKAAKAQVGDAKIREAIEKRIAELTEKSKESAKEAEKASNDAFDRIKKMSTVPFVENMRQSLADYHMIIDGIASGTTELLGRAREEAEKLGIPFETLEKGILSKASEKLQEMLDDVKKTAPELSGLVDEQIRKSVQLDPSGNFEKIVNGLSMTSKGVDDAIQKFQDMAKYMEVPEEAFLPQLRRMQAMELENVKAAGKMTDQWKKTGDMIKSVEAAARSFRNEIGDKARSAMAEIQEMVKEGVMSQKEADAIGKDFVPLIADSVMNEVYETFKGLPVADGIMTRMFSHKLVKTTNDLGMSLEKVNKEITGLKTVKSLDFINGTATEKIKPGTDMDRLGKELLRQSHAEAEIAAQRRKFAEAAAESSSAIGAGTAGIEAWAAGLSGANEEMRGIAGEALSAKAALAEAFGGEAIASGIGQAMSDAKASAAAMGGSLTSATATAARHFQGMAENAASISDRLKGGFALPQPSMPEAPAAPSAGALAAPLQSLADVLGRENVTAQELIRANSALEGRMKSLEAALSKADFRTIKQEIDMDVAITTQQPAQAIKAQLSNATSGV
jgi:hypothetical protein